MLPIPNPDHSQYDAAVEAISNMDIPALQKIFANQENFDHVSVKVILFKLEQVFKQLKQNGDKKLKAIPGYCEVCNKGMRGFRFMAPKAKKNLTLIFEVKNDKVADISHCGTFYTGKTTKEYFPDVTYKIYTDEYLGFEKTNSYQILMADCTEAMSEFDFEKPQILSTEIVTTWIKAYQGVYFDSKHYANCSGVVTFRNLFDLMLQINMYLLAKPTIEEALNSYQEAWLILEDVFENQLMQWLTKVEHLFTDIEEYDQPHDEKASSIALLHTFPTIHIAMNDFTPVDNFRKQFANLYWTNTDKLADYFEKRQREEGNED